MRLSTTTIISNVSCVSRLVQDTIRDDDSHCLPERYGLDRRPQPYIFLCHNLNEDRLHLLYNFGSVRACGRAVATESRQTTAGR
jgi:hypothetical protein